MKSCLQMLLLFVAITAASAQDRADKEERHVEKSGGYSLVPPEGWKAREFPGLKYQVIVGPATNGFAPNLNVVKETSSLKLDDYVKGNRAALQQLFKNFQLVDQGEFKTAGGLQGVKMIVQDEQGNKQLRQTFYFFESGNTKYVVTASALADGGEKLDPVFDKCLKSFRFEKE